MNTIWQIFPADIPRERDKNEKQDQKRLAHPKDVFVNMSFF